MREIVSPAMQSLLVNVGTKSKKKKMGVNEALRAAMVSPRTKNGYRGALTAMLTPLQFVGNLKWEEVIGTEKHKKVREHNVCYLSGSSNVSSHPLRSASVSTPPGPSLSDVTSVPHNVHVMLPPSSWLAPGTILLHKQARKTFVRSRHPHIPNETMWHVHVVCRRWMLVSRRSTSCSQKCPSPYWRISAKTRYMQLGDQSASSQLVTLHTSHTTLHGAVSCTNCVPLVLSPCTTYTVAHALPNDSVGVAHPSQTSLQCLKCFILAC